LQQYHQSTKENASLPPDDRAPSVPRTERATPVPMGPAKPYLFPTFPLSPFPPRNRIASAAPRWTLPSSRARRLPMAPRSVSTPPAPPPTRPVALLMYPTHHRSGRLRAAASAFPSPEQTSPAPTTGSSPSLTSEPGRLHHRGREHAPRSRPSLGHF
jgi:hypothetical protein